MCQSEFRLMILALGMPRELNTWLVREKKLEVNLKKCTSSFSSTKTAKRKCLGCFCTYDTHGQIQKVEFSVV